VSAIIFEQCGAALSTTSVSARMLGFNCARSRLVLLVIAIKIMATNMIKPPPARIATAPNPNIVI